MAVRGIGVDLCSVSRVARLAHRYGERFLLRAFHERESAAYRALLARDGASSCSSEGRTCSASSAAAARFLASRWAAKEALHKALGDERLLFPEVEVTRRAGGAQAGDGGRNGGGASGPPAFAFHGAAAARVAAAGVSMALLSLSHDGDYAVAMVVLS